MYGSFLPRYRLEKIRGIKTFITKLENFCRELNIEPAYAIEIFFKRSGKNAKVYMLGTDLHAVYIKTEFLDLKRKFSTAKKALKHMALPTEKRIEISFQNTWNVLQDIQKNRKQALLCIDDKIVVEKFSKFFSKGFLLKNLPSSELKIYTLCVLLENPIVDKRFLYFLKNFEELYQQSLLADEEYNRIREVMNFVKPVRKSLRDIYYRTIGNYSPIQIVSMHTTGLVYHSEGVNDYIR